MLKPSIDIKNLTILYGSHPAIHHLSVSFQAGHSIAIIGPNGAAKSSLMKAITGKITNYLGNIDITPRQIPIGYLPQVQNFNTQFPISVKEFIAMGCWTKLGMFKSFSTKDQLMLQHILWQLGLEGFEKRLVNELSMGQWKRILLARLMIQNPNIIILDEPFNALDDHASEQLLAILQDWKNQNKLVITILHDYQIIKNHFEFTMIVARELVAYGPTSEVFTVDNLNKMYSMSEAWDLTAPYCQLPS